MITDVRIQQSVVANLSNRAAPIEVGPFVIGMDPTTTSPSINYATPRPGAVITAADVTALVAAFRAANRKPRLEYVISCAPDLEALLTAADFIVEARHTYLLCVPGTLKTPPRLDHLELHEPGTDSQRAALIGAQNEAFGGDPVASEADVARLRRLQDAGGVAIRGVHPILLWIRSRQPHPCRSAAPFPHRPRCARITLNCRGLSRVTCRRRQIRAAAAA